MRIGEYSNKIKKYLVIVIILGLFLAGQIAVIFYAKKNNCVAGGSTDSTNYSMLYRIDQRISSLQSELNYLRGYIVSKTK